jgi:hypothetical protein
MPRRVNNQLTYIEDTSQYNQTAIHLHRSTLGKMVISVSTDKGAILSPTLSVGNHSPVYNALIAYFKKVEKAKSGNKK